MGLLLLGLTSGPLIAAETDPILSAWLEAHGNLETWSAELVQTRHLAALTQPLTSTGKVYYCRPGLFRWELGQPPETIAIRSTNALMMVYPRLKRAERYNIDAGRGGPLRDALTLMEAGFPKNESSLKKQYWISTAQSSDGQNTISLKPRVSAARRLITEVLLTFHAGSFTLASSEIEFTDGSRLENHFTDSVSNPPLPPGLFATNLPADMELVEPFNQ